MGATAQPRKLEGRTSSVPAAPASEVCLRVTFDSVAQLRLDWLDELAEGGLFLRTSAPLPVGFSVGLWVTLPGAARALELSGEVRFHKSEPEQKGLGVALVGVSPASRFTLDALVRPSKTRGAAAPGEEVSTAPADVPRPLRVLLFEPNQVLADVFAHKLQSYARNGAAQALWRLELSKEDELARSFARLSERPCDLAIFDLDGISDRTARAELQARARATPGNDRMRIVLWSSGDAGVKPEPRTLLLTKPFSMRPLLKTLQLLLD